ncbi:MAG: efflux RND transporter permease subunit, partial [Alphaproteobacteria bacterium]|nr:efflux RND transporter permease subunit [Alphaproteobacteria bacterium]
GVRDFAIFFDDLKDDKGRHHENGKLQAEFLNRVQKNLHDRYKDVVPLIMVPTEYYYEDMVKGDKVKPYTRDLAENLDPRIVVLYTGRGVVCDGITDAELAEVNKIFGREVGVWWNYPVNDYSLTPDGNRNVKLALGAIEKLPTAKMTAIFFNPMEQVQLSKIALATGAIYANNPATYDDEKAWDTVLAEQFGNLAPQMKIFAEHSRHMENSWAKVGAPDAIEFSTAAANLMSDMGRKSFIDFAPLERQIDRTEKAVNVLLKRLPKKYLAECKPQLEQLRRIMQADKVALDSLKSGQLDPRLKVLREEIAANEKSIKSVLNLVGFSIMAGQGENVGFGVYALKNWSERTEESEFSTNILNRLSMIASQFSEAKVQLFELPAIPGLGSTNAMDFKIQSVESTDMNQLETVVQNFTMQAMALPEIMMAYSTYNAQTPHAYIEIDREKAESLGVAVGSIYSALQTYVGSSYVNDINIGTQVNKVKFQADWKYRKDLSSLDKIYVQSLKGTMVPLGSLIKIKTVLLPRGIERYNQYPSATINALAKSGVSSGAAMQALEDLADKILPKGYTYAWSGSSLQEKNNQGQIYYIIAFAVLFAYLFMVAQYESWMIPLSVMLSVTAAMLGALLGLFFMKLPLSIYAQLGLVLLVGLAAKNAILIVEFARDARQEGMPILKAALFATKERFRAVLMTAFTFILGVAPLVWASGASAGSRVAVGVPVFWGMIIGTMAGLILIPLMYILVQTITEYKKKDNNDGFAA